MVQRRLSHSAWRVSLPRQLRKRSKSKSFDGEAKAMENLVSHQGVALQVLVGLKDRLEEIRLATVVAQVQGLEVGATVEVVEEDRELGEVVVKVATDWAEVPFVRVPKECIEEKKVWTVEDVCTFVVLPECKTGHPFVAGLESKQQGQRYQGVFVCCARDSSFVKLVDALVVYALRQSIDKLFVWIDIFSVNQHLLMNMDDETMLSYKHLVETGTHEAQAQFDGRVVFFDSWDDPTPLKRAWCVWELYGFMHHCEGDFDVIFDPRDDPLVDIGPRIPKTFTLDPHEMKCANEDDLKLIGRCINKIPGKFPKLKQKIIDGINTWLTLTVEACIKNWDANHSNQCNGGSNSSSCSSSGGSKDDGEEQDERFADLLVKAAHHMVGVQQYEVAISYFHKAINVYKECESFVENVSCLYSDLAHLYQSLGNKEKALEMRRMSIQTEIEVREQREDFEDPSLFADMGKVYVSQRKYEQALEMYEQALVLFSQRYNESDKHIDIAQVYHNLGCVNEALGRNDEAMEQYKKSLAIFLEVLGTENDAAVGSSYHSIAGLNSTMKCYDEALEMYQKALDIYKNTLGDDDKMPMAKTYNNMAIIYHEIKQQYDVALKLYKRAISIFSQVLDSEVHVVFADTYNNLGTLYYDQQKYAKALKMYRKSIDIFMEVLGTDRNPQIANVLINISITLMDAGKPESALGFLNQLRGICESIFTPSHTITRQMVQLTYRCQQLLKKKENAAFAGKKEKMTLRNRNTTLLNAIASKAEARSRAIVSDPYINTAVQSPRNHQAFESILSFWRQKEKFAIPLDQVNV